jgi:hypothetical protein
VPNAWGYLHANSEDVLGWGTEAQIWYSAICARRRTGRPAARPAENAVVLACNRPHPQIVRLGYSNTNLNSANDAQILSHNAMSGILKALEVGLEVRELPSVPPLRA